MKSFHTNGNFEFLLQLLPEVKNNPKYSPSYTHEDVVIERRSEQAMYRAGVCRDCIHRLRADQLPAFWIFLRFPVCVDQVTVLRAREELRVYSFHLECAIFLLTGATGPSQVDGKRILFSAHQNF